MPVTSDSSIQRGGGWLLGSADAAGTFTPERTTGEHRMIARTAGDFVRNEVAPALERLERKDWDLARQLLKRCGELGLLGVDIPEIYGGVGLD
jgi:alkylation response protein AidB-like acyl-CoA dehydrogenase